MGEGTRLIRVGAHQLGCLGDFLNALGRLIAPPAHSVREAMRPVLPAGAASMEEMRARKAV